MAESKELKSLLVKVKKENDKAGLKFNFQKMTSIWSHFLWQIDGGTMETMRDFSVLDSKVMQMVTAAMKLKDTP